MNKYAFNRVKSKYEAGNVTVGLIAANQNPPKGEDGIYIVPNDFLTGLCVRFLNSEQRQYFKRVGQEAAQADARK